MPKKSAKQLDKPSLDSDRESDNSDVQATRALIQKLSPMKPKPVETKVREILYIKEFKILRRLLQRKRHFKIKLCGRLSVGHVRNKRRVLSLAWHERFLYKER